MSLTAVLFSVVSVLEFPQNILKVLGKKNRSLKNLYYKLTSSQVIFKVSNRIFLTYLPLHLFTETFCVLFLFIFVKGILLFLRWKEKEKQETLGVVTIAMICSTSASLRKFQYFPRSIYNPVEHL